MATLIKTDGSEETQYECRGLTSKQDAVGGLIEIVRLQEPEGYVLVVNEEGLIHDLPHNELASHLAGQYIAGNALMMRHEELDM